MDVEERNVEKHSITSDEIDFLIALQQEMNTQDTVCQAPPRFWMVEQSEKKIVPEGYEDGCELYDSEGADTIGEFEDAIEYFKENYERIVVTPVSPGSYRIDITNDDYIPGKDDKSWRYEADTTVSTLDELVSFLEDWNIITHNRYHVCCFKNEQTLCKDTLFLTNKSCKEYIQRYGYNHTDDAHSFAMTAYRSPEVEKLWKILETVNWKELKK